MPQRPVAIYALVDPRTEAVRYIGQSHNPHLRFTRHLWQARVGRGNNRWLAELLALAYAPRLLILEVCPTTNDANERERFWIDLGRKSGWPLTNILIGGNAFTTKRVMPTLRGRPLSNAHRASISRTKTGHKLSEDTKAKMSAVRRGRMRGPMSEATKSRISEAKRAKGQSENSLRAARARRGIPLREETRTKLSTARKGKRRGPPSQATRDKLRSTMRARDNNAFFTPEVRAKISAGLRASHQRRREALNAS